MSSISEKDLLEEKERLNQTKKVINEKISDLGQQLYDKEEKIQEFQNLLLHH